MSDTTVTDCVVQDLGVEAVPYNANHIQGRYEEMLPSSGRLSRKHIRVRTDVVGYLKRRDLYALSSFLWQRRRLVLYSWILAKVATGSATI
jgi:hypothetical protein